MLNKTIHHINKFYRMLEVKLLSINSISKFMGPPTLRSPLHRSAPSEISRSYSSHNLVAKQVLIELIKNKCCVQLQSLPILG